MERRGKDVLFVSFVKLYARPAITIEAEPRGRWGVTYTRYDIDMTAKYSPSLISHFSVYIVGCA
jgi:hypothetical protein